MASPIRVLSVDAREAVLAEIAEHLEREPDFTVETTTATVTNERLCDSIDGNYDCIVSGYELSSQSGIEFLESVRECCPDLPFLLFTDQGNEVVASDATAAGVTEYIPWDSEASLDRLVASIRKHVQVYRSEQAVFPLEEVYELVAKTVTDVFWTVDVDAETVWVSEGISTFGYNSEAGTYDIEWLAERIHPEDHGTLWTHNEALLTRDESAFDRLTDNRGEFSTEFRFQRRDGTYAYCQGRGIVLFDGDDPVEMVGTMTDITEEKTREHELEQAQTRMEVALKAIDATIWEWEAKRDLVTTHPEPHHVLDTEIESVEDFLDPIHPDDRPRVQDKLEDALASNSSYHVEFRVTNGDEIRWVEDYGECWSDERGAQYMVGVAKDVTERTENEQELNQNRERLAAALEVADAGVWEWDPETGTVVWHESTERLFGLEPGSFDGTVDAFLEYVSDGERTKLEAAVEEALPQREPFEAECRVTREDGEDMWLRTWAEFVDIDGLTPRYIGVVTNITELKQYEQTLTTLHGATRELFRSDNSGEVSRRIVYAANGLLDISGSAVLLYDQDDVSLVPEIVSGQSTVAKDTRIEPDQGNIIWQSFIEDEIKVCGQIDEQLQRTVGLAAERAVLVPIGDHGLFVLADDGSPPFDDRTVDLAEILIANAEAALDRISREQELEQRDKELRERTARLEQLDEVNERVRKIIHKLIRATTREEIEEIVCTELVRAERFEVACIGEYNPRREEVTVQTSAGESRDYFDAVSLAGEHNEPMPEAAQSHRLVTVDDIGRDFRNADWRQEALMRGYQSVLAVPIRHDDIPYGVLAVYANSADTFDAETEEVFTELGEAIAHVLRTVVQREALQSDHQVELEFDIDNGSTTLFALSKRLETEIVVERILTQAETHLAYGTVMDTDRERFRRVTEEMTGIDRARVLSADDGNMRVELRITGTSAAMTIADHGGVFRSLLADNGSGTISMLFPASAKINEFIEMFVDRYQNSELSIRREREKPKVPPTDIIESTVTERQQEMLQAAYHSGFFEWPRESTGEEIAESLDISPTTFRENLRRAQRNLLDWYVESSQA